MSKSIPTFFPSRSKAAQDQMKECMVCWKVVYGSGYDYRDEMCKKCRAAFDGKEDED